MIKYIRKKDIISGSLHEELVMMDIDQGKYFALNPTAKRIWELLEEAKTIEKLCNILIEEYKVELDTCRDEVQTLLDEMIRMKLVEEIN